MGSSVFMDWSNGVDQQYDWLDAFWYGYLLESGVVMFWRSTICLTAC
jgi:hypothetical protein